MSAGDRLPLFDPNAPRARSRYDVDDVCAKRSRGSIESERAHDSAKARKLFQHQRIFELVALAGDHGATVEEIALKLGERYTTTSARCAELKHGGRLRKSGRTRATTSGCAAAVLVAVDPV